MVSLKTPERNGYWAVVVGGGSLRAKAMNPRVAGQYLARGIPFKARQEEFKVTEDALLPVGTELTTAHFRPGQKVDVTGEA